MPRKRTSRIYTRSRGGATRYYADFRDYCDVGGCQEALIPPGSRVATDDPDVADALVVKRRDDLNARRRMRSTTGIKGWAALGPYAEHHLREKKKANKVTTDYIGQVEKHLQRAVDFLGGHRNLTDLTVENIRAWLDYLRTLPNHRGGTLSEKTIRDHLDSLSNLYRRAASEQRVTPGFNPPNAILEKPSGSTDTEAHWLEVHDAALFLEAAHGYEPPPDKHGASFMFELVATFLLTGGRKSEVLGLEVHDISVDRGTVTFRPNQWRRLKTKKSRRTLPLWPQLDEILRPYVLGDSGPREGLLFPSLRTGGLVWDTRKALDSIGKLAGFAPGEVRTKAFRHTYASARLQTLDNGEPVSDFTVAKELGHGGRAMLDRVYGHLGTNRHRSEVVEFRVTQHEERLGERLQHLRLVS